VTDYARVRLNEDGDFATLQASVYWMAVDLNIAKEVFKDGLPQRKRPWHG